MATTTRFNTTADDFGRRARNAYWVSAIVFVTLAVGLAASVIQTLSQADWRLYLLTGANMAACLLVGLAMIASPRRPEQALLAATLAGCFAAVAAAVTVARVGVPLGFILITGVVLLSTLTVSRAWAFGLISLAALAGLLAVLLQYLAPPFQLSLNNARPAILLVCAALLLPLIGLIVRRFAYFTLRLKLILLCIIVALIPLALSLQLNFMLARAAAADPATAMMSFNEVVDNALLTGIGIMALAAALAVLAGRSLVAPLKRLTAVVDKVKSGNIYTDARIEANDEIGALAATVNQMTDQLRNIWVGLEQRTTDRSRASALNAAVSRRLSTILDQSQLLKEVAELLREGFNFYHVQICLLDQKRENLVFAGGTGDAGRTMLERGYQIPVGQGPLGRAAELNTVVHIPDVIRDVSWLPNPLLPDTKVELAVPITLGDRVLGVIDIHKNTFGGIRPEDTEIIQSIGGQLAVALRNAQSFAQAQQQASQITVFNGIVQKIQETADPDSALQIAVAELGPALKGTRLSLRRPAAAAAPPKAPDSDETLAAPITFPIHAGGRWVAELVVEGLRDLNQSSGLINAVTGQLGLHLEKLEQTRQAQAAAAESQSLAQASQRFNGADALDKVLRAAVEPAIHAGANDALLFVYDLDEAGQPEWLEVRANWVREGSFAIPVGVRLFATSQPALRLLADQPDLPVLIGDVVHDERLDAALRQAYHQLNTQATAILPLVQNGRKIGLVTANWTAPHSFTDTQTRLFKSLASLAAVAASNLLLQSRAKAALAESEQLYHAGRRITSATSLQEIVSDLAENVPIPAVNRAVLITLDQPAGPGAPAAIQVVSNWHSGRGAAPAAVGTEFGIRTSAGQSIFLRSEPGFFDDAQLDSSIDPGVRALFAGQRVRGLAILPLWAGARQLGCLLIESDDPHHFTESEIRPFTSLAQQMAIVVENRQLTRQTQTALAESDLFYQASAQLNAAADLDGLLRVLIQPAIDTGAVAGGLLTFELDGAGGPAWGTVAAAWSRAGETLFPAGARLHLADFALSRLWIHDPAAPLYLGDVVNDSRIDPEIYESFEQSQTRSAIWLPLSVGRRRVGIAYVYWREPREFSQRERRLFESLRAQAAPILENFALLANSQKRADRESVINLISQKIQGATSVEGAVQTAVRELGQALKARRTVVELAGVAGRRNGS